jgi:hypothetical protein
MAEMKLPRGVSPDKFLDMVRAATFDAVLAVLGSGSTDKSAAGGLTNLLAAIRDGTEAATTALLRSGELRPAIPKSVSEPDAPAAEGEPPKS